MVIYMMLDASVPSLRTQVAPKLLSPGDTHTQGCFLQLFQAPILSLCLQLFCSGHLTSCKSSGAVSVNVKTQGAPVSQD